MFNLIDWLFLDSAASILSLILGDDPGASWFRLFRELLLLFVIIPVAVLGSAIAGAYALVWLEQNYGLPYPQPRWSHLVASVTIAMIATIVVGGTIRFTRWLFHRTS